MELEYDFYTKDDYMICVTDYEDEVVYIERVGTHDIAHNRATALYKEHDFDCNVFVLAPLTVINKRGVLNDAEINNNTEEFIYN